MCDKLVVKEQKVIGSTNVVVQLCCLNGMTITDNYKKDHCSEQRRNPLYTLFNLIKEASASAILCWH